MKRYFEYDHLTGIVRYMPRTVDMFKSEADMKTWNTKFAGKECNSIGTNGYLRGTVNRVKIACHLIAWELYYGNKPTNVIDHIDGDVTNNKIVNLRNVTQHENTRNACKPINNTSGVMGVSWDKSRNKWVAGIKVNYKRIALGRFDDINDAIYVRKQAEIQYGFHANHGR